MGQKTAVRAKVRKAHVDTAPIGIFISYSNENESLARKLKDKLELLKDAVSLDIFIAAELGGEEWRKYLWAKLADARILILPYTSPHMKLDWCSYELGRFHAHSRLEANHTICLLNKNIEDPPDQVSEWQAYRADKAGLRRFFIDFFVNGKFSDKRPLNSRLLTEDRYAKAFDEAVLDLEAEFAQFRVEEQYFPFRVTVASPNQGKLPSRLDFETARVSGDTRALQLFGVNEKVHWRTLRRKHVEKWMHELEQVAAAPSGELVTQSLTPFSLPNKGTYIPVISRIESFEDKEPWRMSVLFIEVGKEGPGSRDAVRKAMPDHWAKVMSYLDAGLRLRWEHLAPVHSVVLDSNAKDETWKAAATRLLGAIVELQTEMQEKGNMNRQVFFSNFDPDLRATMKTNSQPYQQALANLRASIESGDRATAARCVETIMQTNSSFMDNTLAQLQRFIKALDQDTA